jgi:hypothetical protein
MRLQQRYLMRGAQCAPRRYTLCVLAVQRIA